MESKQTHLLNDIPSTEKWLNENDIAYEVSSLYLADKS